MSLRVLVLVVGADPGVEGDSLGYFAVVWCDFSLLRENRVSQGRLIRRAVRVGSGTFNVGHQFVLLAFSTYRFDSLHPG